MKKYPLNCCYFLQFWLSLLCGLALAQDVLQNNMSKEERDALKEEARDMFYHAYRAYMENAYPADELMPLSCQGRYRGVTPHRGDMDDILGNFSLTLVDSLDTLVILGDFEEFEDAVKLVIKDVSFDKNIVVSVFETNIRMLGGLLSAHVLAADLQDGGDYMSWYRGELLDLAHDLGKRLLPAFNTSTGIPHARVNLRYGMRGIENSRETCTACAGTMILEMAALSRLTGETVFEKKAHHAMDRLWKIRNRTSDLMGTVMNIHSGDWIRKDSGVGAGIDSYYEYCLKAYILLGDENYLARFYRHYNAVMKYISRGPMMLDVHMHRPHTQSRHFMDALLAFWPGLQVLLGDVKPAVETHEMLYQLTQRHTFIPEAFTADFQVHWGQHPLRPEFLESTYFLHRATGDDHYLQVGKSVLKSLQKHARVPCGYAAMNDVRTRIHEDRMDSFVLAETFKYLYILFSEESELPVNLDKYIMTTEAHLLPLSLAENKNMISKKKELDDDHRMFQYSRTCANTAENMAESFRKPISNLVGECGSNGVSRSQIIGGGGFRRILARHFRPGNPHHIRSVSDMGISVLTLDDGRLQLLHTFSTARSAKDAEEGLIFMREMADLSERVEVGGAVGVAVYTWSGVKILPAGPAHFGFQLQGNARVSSTVVFADPPKACSALVNPQKYKQKIVIAQRGDCTFADKVRRIEKENAKGVIIVDNIPGSSQTQSPLFAMSEDGEDNIIIPAVFLYSQDADILTQYVKEDPLVEVVLGDKAEMERDYKNFIERRQEPFRSIGTFQFQIAESLGKMASGKDNEFKQTSSSDENELLRFLKLDKKENSEETDAEIQKVANNWAQSIFTKFDSQIFFPMEKIVANLKESENSKVSPIVVAKLLEEMKTRLHSIHDMSINKQAYLEYLLQSDENIGLSVKKLTEHIKRIEEINEKIKSSQETLKNMKSTIPNEEIQLDEIALLKHSQRDEVSSNRLYLDSLQKAKLYLNSDIYKKVLAEKLESEKALPKVKLQRVEIDPELVEKAMSPSHEDEKNRDRPHHMILMDSKFDLLKDGRKPICIDCQNHNEENTISQVTENEDSYIRTADIIKTDESKSNESPFENSSDSYQKDEATR